jgi:hypothetical protein
MKKLLVVSYAGALLTASSMFAVELTEGWNLVASCQDQNVVDLDLTNITEIQGDTVLYKPAQNRLGVGKTLDAGVGYWVKADADTEVDFGSSSSQPSVDIAEGWNLLGACIDVSVTDLALDDVEEIQGDTVLYKPAQNRMGDGKTLDAGFGYWVKASADTTSDAIFGATDETSDTSEIPPMPGEIDSDFPSFPAE